MIEGRIPKGDPPPPDDTDSTTDAQRNNIETEDEAEVQAYQQPANMEAQEAAAPTEMGDPPPPDTEGSSA